MDTSAPKFRLRGVVRNVEVIYSAYIIAESDRIAEIENHWSTKVRRAEGARKMIGKILSRGQGGEPT